MLNEKIIKIKKKLYSEKIEKTGKNTFQNFSFFELKDFLPRLIELMDEEEINDLFTIENNEAILILNYKEEKNTYKIPFILFDTPLNKLGKESMQPIQYLGALNTYYKRYLYLNAFSISENDVIDNMNKDDLKTKDIPTQNKGTNPKKEDDKGFDRTKTIEWLNEKYSSNDEEFKAYLKAKLKYFKRSAPTYLKAEELQEIIQELKEKKEVNKLKKMIDFINSNKEKHAELIGNALRDKESPFVDMLEESEIEELYRLIKGVEAS